MKTAKKQRFVWCPGSCLLGDVVNTVISVDNCVTGVINLGLFTSGVVMGANQFTVNSISHLALKPLCGVYLLVDSYGGYTYVGSSTNIRTRTIQHLSCIATNKAGTAYKRFNGSFIACGYTAFTVTVLEECPEEALIARERYWINELNPSENSDFCTDGRQVYSDEERALRAARVSALWATPEYRERAVAARLGKAYNKGYRCTPEQVLNRKKAARISNMKRNYGEEWKKEYARRYPEFTGDING